MQKNISPLFGRCHAFDISGYLCYHFMPNNQTMPLLRRTDAQRVYEHEGVSITLCRRPLQHVAPHDRVRQHHIVAMPVMPMKRHHLRRKWGTRRGFCIERGVFAGIFPAPHSESIQFLSGNDRFALAPILLELRF